jgi:nucleotide-binding universal stress UspA family protein
VTKILVTTDLSKYSKSGIAFAIQLAAQSKASLVFFQVIDVQRPTRWNEREYEQYVKNEENSATVALNNFISAALKESGSRYKQYTCVAKVGSPVGETIIAYARKIKANFICIGTRGAGRLQRIFGTHTSDVIKHSPVPVFAIPKNYRKAPITHLLYSTDLSQLSGELKKVKKFADSIKAKVSVLHFDYLYHLKETQDKLHKVAQRHKDPGVKIYFEKMNVDQTLDAHLRQAVQHYKPSVLVLFTNQHRDWYERVFLSSNSAHISFSTIKPLLIFPK